MDRRHRDPGVLPGCRRGRPRGRDGDLGNEATAESRRTCWIQRCPRRMTSWAQFVARPPFPWPRPRLALGSSRSVPKPRSPDRGAKRGHSWTRPAPPALALGRLVAARHGAPLHGELAATPSAERAVPGTARAPAAPRLARPAVTRLVQRAVRDARGPQGPGACSSRRSTSGPGGAARPEARERAAGRRSGARQLVEAAGDAATAALTALSAAADEAQARLAEKARMRELEHAVVTARAGGHADARRRRVRRR